MILYETINTKRIPADELCSSDELYSSETLGLMPLASCFGFEEPSPGYTWQCAAEWGDAHPPYPFFAFDDDEDEDDIDEDDNFDDLDDDFDDDFEDEDFEDDFEDEDDEDGYDYDDDIEYEDFDE